MSSAERRLGVSASVLVPDSLPKMFIFLVIVAAILFLRFLPMFVRYLYAAYQKCRGREPTQQQNRAAAAGSDPENPQEAQQQPARVRTIDLLVFDYMRSRSKSMCHFLRHNAAQINWRTPDGRPAQHFTDILLDNFEASANAEEEPGTDTTCCICLCEYDDGEMCAKSVACEHIWHKECIEAWIKKGHWTCPVCRANLLSQDPVAAPSTSSPSEAIETPHDALEAAAPPAPLPAPLVEAPPAAEDAAVPADLSEPCPPTARSRSSQQPTAAHTAGNSPSLPSARAAPPVGAAARPMRAAALSASRPGLPPRTGAGLGSIPPMEQPAPVSAGGA